VKGHAHSTNQHWYKKVDGEWKFAGLNPEIRWSEFDFDKVFEEGREELGEKKTEEKIDEMPERVEKVETGNRRNLNFLINDFLKSKSLDMVLLFLKLSLSEMQLN
jgi:hypothetical protein